MIQAIFGGIFLEHIGLLVRWLILCIIDTVRGKEPKSFKTIKNKYRGITADSVAYGFGNKVIGTVFLLVVILAVFKAESLFQN
ncbi:hypothetical protein [Pontibacter actiniarum]|uniref:Uncharacterized protein n=1 Tax=Pontibacter actiniarum TaxID=323450 RepID=A0A1X9YSG4_9BACT|nr:hypothetical protein [Pontibacter actiniarum]ARS35819.1 hypothetical protein CA264_10395 [Pontibacter actiniarum]